MNIRPKLGLIAVAIAAALASCALGEPIEVAAPAGLSSSDDGDAAEASSIVAEGGAREAGDRPDASRATDANVSASPSDAASSETSASDTSVSDVAPTSLDPDVVLPDPSAPPCSPPGSLLACSGIQACRLASPAGGRCDDCFPLGRCMGFDGDPCSQSLDCDVDLQCFRGKCTRFCALPQGTGCAASSLCVDVGHPTVGLCGL